MGYQDLKSKLSGNEEGFPVNDETVQEWINMPAEDKKVLIGEAKEKGGKWRTSLLEIDQKAKKVIEEALEKDPTGYSPPDSWKDPVNPVKKVTDPLKKWAEDHPGKAGGAAAASLAAGLGAMALAKKMRASKKAAAK